MDNVFGNLNYNEGDYGGGLDNFGDYQFPGNPFAGGDADPEPQVVQDQPPLDGIVVAGVDPEVDDEGLIAPANVIIGDEDPFAGGDADLELVQDQPQVVQDQLPLVGDGIVVAGVDPEVDDEGLIAPANVIIGDEGLAPAAADYIIGDAGLIAPAVAGLIAPRDKIIGPEIHKIQTLAALKTELAKARDPTLRAFLDPLTYVAFVLNADQLNIHEIDPKKLPECILCAQKEKSKYRDGIAYLEGTIAGDYKTYTLLNGQKCTYKSRYTTAIGAGTHTERRVYKFDKSPYVILHYLQLPNLGASEGVLAKSAPPPSPPPPPPPPSPPQATLNDLSASLEDFRAETNDFRAETNAKLDAMASQIGRVVGLVERLIEG